MSAWLQLLRIANLPTAWSNVLMAFLLSHGCWSPVDQLMLLLLSSSCFYLAGMVLNDVFDIERDKIERPERPLPSARISMNSASTLGYGLLVSGIFSAGLAGAATTTSHLGPITRCLGIALALALAIWLYNGPLKSTSLAPWTMGACRLLNVCLGASTFTGQEHTSLVSPFGLTWPVLWVGGWLLVLIAGVTLLGRNETKAVQNRFFLSVAVALIVAGLVGLASLVYIPLPVTVSSAASQRFPFFVLLIAVPVIRNVLTAVIVATPTAIQRGVIAVLSSLIFLDAIVCYLVRPDQIAYSLTVLCLLLPVLAFKRVVKMT